LLQNIMKKAWADPFIEDKEDDEDSGDNGV
jgi:hypothetical protein